MEEKLPIKSLYLHYPFCRHLCNYCDFYKSVKKDEAEVRGFEDLLSAMFIEHKKLIDQEGFNWESLDSLYIGGGTPSLWGVAGANYLKGQLDLYGIELSKNVEFTLEVNPGSWSLESLNSWKGIGVNRYSLGIQSLNPAFIKLLDRVHNLDDVYETLSFFKKTKANFSVDFMLGLPHSEKFKRNILLELKEILSFNPDHISLYILTVKDNYIHSEALPDEHWIEREYLEVSDYLIEQGFLHYEVSNFAKPGFSSFHNLEYWKMNSVAAIGPSATGFLGKKSIRYKWKNKSAEFKREDLTTSEVFLETVYMGLRINEGLPFNLFSGEEIREIARGWCERDLAIIENERVILTSRGFLILDSLMDELFIKIKDSF